MQAPFFPALAPLIVWHRIVVLDALVLAIEGVLLVFLTQYRRRPRFEQILAAAPAVAFLWVAYAARGLDATYLNWRTYASWVTSHYLPAFAHYAFDGLDTTVAAATRLGWLAFVVTLGMAELGWAVLLQRRVAAHAAPHIPTVWSSEVPKGDDGLDITVGPID